MPMLSRVQLLLENWQHARILLAILAETGRLTWFATGRAVVKHAGLAPREMTRRRFRANEKAHPSRIAAVATIAAAVTPCTP